MKNIKKFIQLTLTFAFISTFSLSTNAINKNEKFRPNNNMFTPSPLEKNQLTSFSIFLDKKPDFVVDGATAQIFTKSFKNQIVKDFQKQKGHNIEKYIDDNELFSFEKTNLKNIFSINIDFNKNIKNINNIIKDFSNYVNYLNKNKESLKIIVNKTKNDIKQNFEKYRKDILKDLNLMAEYHKKRIENLNTAVSSKNKKFIKDYSIFTNAIAKSFENTNKNKNVRLIHKKAEQMKNESKKLNKDSKIFRMYKQKLNVHNTEEINNFSKKYKNSLSNVNKKQTLRCASELLNNGVKLQKY